ncbi:MAG TPA: Wzz/FepE/Etk N-terminal domain-containing protein, partial [Tepidisphaeraceae bacterium]|nr:Wzz/FepE/Etk N-terminal domain-containing protein [Tepidisphaeraceae bacterium]
MQKPMDIVVRPNRPEQFLPAYGNSPPGGAQGLPPETPERSLLAPILRQWWLVLIFMLMGAGIAAYYLSRTVPLYNSYSKIYIEPTASAVAEALGSVERGNYLSTQVEVIQSSQILSRVADAPGIRGMKTFLPANGDPVAFLREQLSVELERKTDMIVVSLNSPWPDEAAAIVTAVVNAYDAYCSEARDDKNNKLLQSLEKTKAEQDALLDKLNEDRRAFRIKHANLSDKPENNPAQSDNLGMISASLTEAQIKLIDASVAYGSGHPNVIALQNSVAGLRHMYDDEMEKLKRQNEGTADLQELNGKISQATVFEEKLAERIRTIQMATNGRKLIEINVFEPARVPDSPSFPRKYRTMAIAIVAGMLLGAGLALLRDRLDGRMRSVEEIQNIIGLPILGVVP